MRLGRKRHSAEQIIAKLREAEVALATGQPLAAVVRKLEIAEQTYYRWRKGRTTLCSTERTRAVRFGCW